MTSEAGRTRSARGELTADLLADLERGTAALPASQPTSEQDEWRPSPAPALQTSVRIAPRGWRLPALWIRPREVRAAIGPLDIALILER